jgi:hypothetical protein
VKQYAKYYAGLIALYIVVAKGSNFGQTIKAGADGFATATKSLQGN